MDAATTQAIANAAGAAFIAINSYFIYRANVNSKENGAKLDVVKTLVDGASEALRDTNNTLNQRLTAATKALSDNVLATEKEKNGQ